MFQLSLFTVLFDAAKMCAMRCLVFLFFHTLFWRVEIHASDSQKYFYRVSTGKFNPLSNKYLIFKFP